MTNRRRRAAGVVLALLLAAASGCSLRGPGGPAGSGGPGAAEPSAPASERQDRPLPAPVAPAAPVPARLVAFSGSGASSQCLAEIEAFAERHTGSRVMLGEAAFADSDQLVLTRMPRRGSDGRPLDGRSAMPHPVVLKLLRGAGGCSVRVADAPAAPGAEPVGVESAGAESASSRTAGADTAGAASAPKDPVEAAAVSLPGCRCVPIER